ncbi:MupA/Atu3671 family FMN-dependent luciferase-like monooxygenase [Actinosynnema sp. NPDC053489]|uniref:MupA/Atu3671 family FMN-dependent luciferase-like monooxygenase n=1 Tax=Actinosynnema sp. NPDC053489 TaxID=3363916 RepID=UPI0037CAA5DC
MDFSLFYFANDSGATERDRYRLLLDGARFADENGFTAVWTPERHFHPFGGLYPNPSVTGAAVAAVTSRVGVRAGSVVAPLHHPARIAEEWSVVDNLSGGRVGLSFASGWHAADFALRPENYADRRRATLDAVDAVRRLWRGERLTFPDGTGQPRELAVYPPPVQPELPVWLTSAGSAETFRAAGAAGCGLLTHLIGQDLAQLREKIAQYRAARPDGRGHVVLMVHTFLGEDDDRVRDAVRGPLSSYIRSSLGLLLGSGVSGARRVDPAALPAGDLDFLVERAFERYYDGGALLGGIAKCAEVVEAIRDADVDEVACLIDFGLPTDAVLDALPALDVLRRSVSLAPTGHAER